MKKLFRKYEEVWGRGTAVYLELDKSAEERDKYGRLLAHIWLEDGKLFNETLN